MSLDAIGIIGEDPKRSVAFYALLGIELKKFGEHDHYEGSVPNGLRIMFDSADLIRQFHPEWKKPNGAGVVLCFKQSSAEGVDELFEKITGSGFKAIKAPWNAFWGQRYACVSDPDGNQIDLFAAL